MKQSFPFGPSRYRLLVAALLFLLHLTAPPCGALEEESWLTMLSLYRGYIERNIKELRLHEKTFAESGRANYRAGLLRMEREHSQILFWCGGTSILWLNRDALNALNALKVEVENLQAPLKKQMRWAQELAAESKSMTGELERLDTTVASAAEKNRLTEEIDKNSRLQKDLERFQSTLKNELETGEYLQTKISKKIQAFSRKTAETLKTWLLEPAPHLADPKIWQKLLDIRSLYPASQMEQYRLIALELSSKRFKSLFSKVMLLWLTSSLLFVWIAAYTFRKYVSRKPLLFLCASWIIIAPGIFLAVFQADLTFVMYYHANQAATASLYTGMLLFACFTASLQPCGDDYATMIRIRMLKLLTGLLLLEIIARLTSTPYLVMVLVYTVFLLLSGLYLRRLAWSGPEGQQLKPSPYLLFFFLFLAGAVCAGFIRVVPMVIAATFLILSNIQFYLALSRFFRRPDDALEAQATGSLASNLFKTLILPLLIIVFLLGNLWLFTYKTGTDRFFSQLLSYQIQVGTVAVSPQKLLTICIAFIFVRTVIIIIDALIERQSRLRIYETSDATETIKTISRYGVWGFSCIGVLIYLNFSLTSIFVVLGGMSVGLGFGLQHIVNNFFSGLILLFGKDLRPSDLIQLGTVRARVRKVTITNTVVQSKDNATIFIPNSELVSRQLMNWSHSDRSVRLDIELGIDYDSDIPLVNRLLLQSVAGHPEILPEPEPVVLLWNFGADALEYRLRFWIRNVDNDTTVMSDVRNTIVQLFREHQVVFAFPQRDLHIRTGTEALPHIQQGISRCL